MDGALRIRYLHAMGIDVWMPRGGGSAPSGEDANDMPVRPAAGRASTREGTRFVVGPGSGSVLLLCSDPGDAALPLAADIARCLADEPVWGWSASDDAGMTLTDAVRDRLFTGVLVFGDAVDADAVTDASSVRGSARVVRAAALDELVGDAGARRTLWEGLRATGWCAPRRGDP